MDKLEALPSVVRLSERVVRILGQNPGKFTLQGTNTYLIGTKRPYLLVDTGEGKAEYEPVLESALKDLAQPFNSSDPDVSDVIISHWHKDHIGGLEQVLTLLRRLWNDRNPSSDHSYKPPRLHKFPLTKESSYLNERSDISSFMKNIPADLYTSGSEGAYFHDLHDGQALSSPSTSLHVLHTPGHTLDSICLHIPEDKALYTADTVLGQGTAVFENLGHYITSLKKMLDFANKGDGEPQYTQLYPGHGPVVVEGTKMIETYIKHRLDREKQIVQVLKQPPPSSNEYWTTWTLVGVIYKDYPENLWLPAAHGVNLHLLKLEEEGRVKKLGGDGKDTQWKLIE